MTTYNTNMSGNLFAPSINTASIKEATLGSGIVLNIPLGSPTQAVGLDVSGKLIRSASTVVIPDPLKLGELDTDNLNEMTSGHGIILGTLTSGTVSSILGINGTNKLIKTATLPLANISTSNSGYIPYSNGTNLIESTNLIFNGTAFATPTITTNTINEKTTDHDLTLQTVGNGNLALLTNGTMNLLWPNLPNLADANTYIGYSTARCGELSFYKDTDPNSDTFVISDPFAETIEFSQDAINITAGQQILLDSNDDGSMTSPLLKINCSGMTSGTTIFETFGKDNTHYSRNDFTFNTACLSTLGILVNGGVTKNGGITIDETGTKINAITTGTIATGGYVGVNSSGYLVKAALADEYVTIENTDKTIDITSDTIYRVSPKVLKNGNLGVLSNTKLSNKELITLLVKAVQDLKREVNELKGIK